LAFFVACDESSNPAAPETTETDFLLVDEIYTAGTKVSLYALDSLQMGYNQLYVTLADSVTGEALSNDALTFTPLMHMPTMTHSAPWEVPARDGDPQGHYSCGVVFIMAGQWELNVGIPMNGTTAQATFAFEVKASNRVKSTVGSDGMMYFVTMLEPMVPGVGLNDFEMCIHKKATMMDFPAVTDFAVDMEPSMPSMGHGSPNNVDPVHHEKGHYHGKVNFTMTGDWRIDIAVSQDTTDIAAVYFELMVD
jgi:hypothetical protein